MERFTIDVLKGTMSIHHATCPNGCGLIDPTVKIGGLPSIKLDYIYDHVRGVVYLDSVYGRYEYVVNAPVPLRQIVEFYCPSCDTNLTYHETTCERCGAPMFKLNLENEGVLTICTRRGCPHSYILVMDEETKILYVYEKEEVEEDAISVG